MPDEVVWHVRFLGEGLWKKNPKWLGCNPCHVWIKIQAHQFIAFTPGFKPDVTLIARTPPRARKIVLALASSGTPDWESILEWEHP